MTVPGFETPLQIKAAIQDFTRLANIMGMPEAEQRDVLGLSRDEVQSWEADTVDLRVPAPGLVRRLGYALPLMRRMVANMASGRAGRVAAPEHRTLN